MTETEMIEKFQCLGCVCGGDPKGCESYTLMTDDSGYFCCGRHVAGTVIMSIGSVYLGLPKGFNHVGMRSELAYRRADALGAHSSIRLWRKSTAFRWDRFNVAVWAMEQDGYLFVRTYSPRINNAMIDVVEAGSLDLVPGALNVAEFVDEID